MVKVLNFLAPIFFLKPKINFPKKGNTSEDEKDEVKIAKAILSFLKEFKLSDYKNRSIEKNHNPSLELFKSEYNLFRNMIKKYSIPLDKLGISDSDLADMGMIAIL